MLARALAALLLLTTGLAGTAAAWPDLQQVKKIGGGEKDVVLIASVEKSVFVQSIPGANANAELWYNYFTAGRGTPPDRVRMLRDAQVTSARLRKSAHELAGLGQPGGTLWFVFIGHGATSPDGKDGLLVGADVQQDPDSLVDRSVPRGELMAALGKTRADRVVAIIDACFSGRSHSGKPLIPGIQPLVVLKHPLPVPARTIVLTASQSNEFAGPLPGEDRPAFSYLALGALRGWARTSPSEPITASDVQSYAARVLRTTVADRTQTPTLEGPANAKLGVGWESAPPAEPAAAVTPPAPAPAPAPVAPPPPPPPRPPEEAHLRFDGRSIGALIELRGPHGPVQRGRVPWTATVTPGNVMVRVSAPSMQSRQMALSLAPGETRDVSLNLAPAYEIGLVWVRLNAGSFTRGSGEGDPDERPTRRLQIAAFEMMQTEVTVGAYRACVRAGGCNQHHLTGVQLDGQSFQEDEHCNWITPGFDRHPINCIDHEQARAFCEWVGGRLPTESEWEYAARGRDSRTYAWGEEPPSCRRAVLNDGSPGCGLGGTAPVCSHPQGSTPAGLCDLSGNVWEWVADWYDPNGYSDGDDVDPWGPASGKSRTRRGGGFGDSPEYLRASNRWSLEPLNRSAGLGFRCARSR